MPSAPSGEALCDIAPCSVESRSAFGGALLTWLGKADRTIGIRALSEQGLLRYSLRFDDQRLERHWRNVRDPSLIVSSFQRFEVVTQPRF